MGLPASGDVSDSLQTVADGLDRLTAAVERLREAVAACDPEQVTWASDAVMAAAAAPVKLTAEVLAEAYRAVPASRPGRPALSLVPGA